MRRFKVVPRLSTDLQVTPGIGISTLSPEFELALEALKARAEIAPHFPDLEILKLLGACGMGAVYQARQPQLDRAVVGLKIPSLELLRELRCLIDAQRAGS